MVKSKTTFVLRISRSLRFVFRLTGYSILVLIICVLGIYIHICLFPLSLESIVRRNLLERYFVRPAIADGWGTLMTRVIPLDGEHLAVGLSTSVGILHKEAGRFELCARSEGVGIIHDLAVRGHTLYVAAGGENLEWFDVRDPCVLRKRGSFLFGGYGFGLHIQQDRLFLANRSGGLAVFRLDPEGMPSFERNRYGSVHTLDDGMEGKWMTNDITAIGDLLVAADGNKGLLIFKPDDRRDRGIRAVFMDELTVSPDMRNIDPAPLRVRVSGKYLYVAMREKGVAILRYEGGDIPVLLPFLRPDDGDVLDLLIAEGALFVPTTKGNIYAFDLVKDPECRSSPKMVYAIGGDASIHSIGYWNPYLYVSAVGSGLFEFHKEESKPVLKWRPPDEFRAVAIVGKRLVVALGGGGVSVYEDGADGLRATSHRDMPSFTFDVLPIGDNRFAVCADLAGTYLFSLDPEGQMRLSSNIPTPEHVFSAAFLPPDRLATANGVFGLLSYRLETNPDSKGFLAWKGMASPAGYVMHVDAWNGEFIGANISGSVQFFPETGESFLVPRPSRCFMGAPSSDQKFYALACDGSRVNVWSIGPDKQPRYLSFRHSRDVTSLLPDFPFLIVGGFPDHLSIYKIKDREIAMEKDFTTIGTPYEIIKDRDRFLIAAGREGLLQLLHRQEEWLMEKIPIRRDR